MNICIAGGSGFIGSYLTGYVQHKGHRVNIIRRQDFTPGKLMKLLDQQEVLFNFLGEPVQGRWTQRKKSNIYKSRIDSTKMLADVLNVLDCNLKLWINASAVGIYDAQHEHDEQSKHIAGNFMAKVVSDWEDQVFTLKKPGIRKVVLRLGIVMGQHGGLIRQLKKAARWKIGIQLKVDNALPFIHIQDLARAVDHIIERSDLSGALNAVCPERITTASFIGKCNARLHPWITFPVNATLLRLGMGEGAVLFTEGQRVIPGKLLQSGFSFDFPDSDSMLDEIFV